MMLLVALLFAAPAGGLAQLNKGHYLEAKAALEHADPKDPAALLALAELRLTEREYEAAEKLSDAALAIDARSAHAHFLKGRALAEQIDSVSIFSKLSFAKRMKAEFDRAAELDPDSAEAREALCEFYLRAPGIAGGSVEKARSLALELGQIDRARGLLEQAQVAAHENEDPAAILAKALTAARTPEERSAVQLAFAALLLGDGKKDKALQHFRAATEAAPDDARALSALSDALVKTGDPQAAVLAARKAVAVDPAAAYAHFYLAEALRAAGDKGPARAEYEAYLKAAPPRSPRAAAARDQIK